MQNKFRAALLNGKVTLGAWMQIGHPGVAEIFARRGFDWVCVDLEHGIIDLESMAQVFRAMSAFDSVPVARLPLNDPIWIHRCLDAGARGLIIPMVKTAAEAQRAVQEAKYPPLGGRGFGYSRANWHGIDFDQYRQTANDEIALIMQIEHKDAIANLEEIAAVNGVDGLFIGPLDLSGSMGIVGQLDHPDMKAALAKYREVCQRRRLSAGLHIVRPDKENLHTALSQGYTLIALGVDCVFLDESSKMVLQAARQP